MSIMSVKKKCFDTAQPQQQRATTSEYSGSTEETQPLLMPQTTTTTTPVHKSVVATKKEEKDSSSSYESGILPWAFQGLSHHFLPSDTEFVHNNNDNNDNNEEEYESYRNSRNCSDRYSNEVLEEEHPQSVSRICFKNEKRVTRSVRRKIFLLLTEPQSSIASAIFFVLLILTIFASNVIMMMQTMDHWLFTPDDCLLCGGTNDFYTANDDNNDEIIPISNIQKLNVPCQCPPAPKPIIVALEDWLIIFFTVEWTLRVLCFVPHGEKRQSRWCSLLRWLRYLTETSTVLDALAIFPYYLELYDKTNGLLSLRLLRLFRLFQLVRLGQYNVTFLCLVNVLVESIKSFNLLLIVLLFGASFFGSMIYWFEKGTWQYTEYTDPPSFQYMRLSADGLTLEPSPFKSIPASFWWFIVTATTVGYGDIYPTTVAGKCVAAFAVLTGVLVIAFPVSVFSDLWSKELKKAGALSYLKSRDEEAMSHGGIVIANNDQGVVPSSGSRRNEEPMYDGFSDQVVNEEEEITGKRKKNGFPNVSSIPENKKLAVQIDGKLSFSSDELAAIYGHMKTIDESQQKIRHILSRLDEPTHENSAPT